MQSSCLRCSRGRGHVAVVVVGGSRCREQVAAVFIVSVGGSAGVFSGDDVGEAVVAGVCIRLHSLCNQSI
jgi:hypothetical protein